MADAQAPTPAADVAPAEASEGDDLTFTVTLTEPYISRPRLNWTASIESDDTAIRADLGASGLLYGSVNWIGGGPTGGSFKVPTREDTVLEDDETFTVTLEAVEGVTLGENPTAKGTILNDDTADTTAPSLTGVITHADGRIIDLVFDAPYEDPVVIGPVGQTPVEPADPVPEAYAGAFSLTIDGVAVNTEPPYGRRRRPYSQVRLRLLGRKDWPPDQGFVRYGQGQAPRAELRRIQGQHRRPLRQPGRVLHDRFRRGARDHEQFHCDSPYHGDAESSESRFLHESSRDGDAALRAGHHVLRGVRGLHHHAGADSSGRDAWSRIEFLDADDNTIEDVISTWYGAAASVDLAVGENVIKVKVTAEAGDATRTYTLTVTREGLVNARAPAGTAGLLEMNWTEPAGSAYEVQYWPADEDGRTFQTRWTTDKRVLIWPLAADTEYKLRVRARSADGWGDWSAAVTARTGAPQSGRPVVSLHLLDAGGSEITEAPSPRAGPSATGSRRRTSATTTTGKARPARQGPGGRRRGGRGGGPPPSAAEVCEGAHDLLGRAAAARGAVGHAALLHADVCDRGVLGLRDAAACDPRPVTRSTGR